MSKEYDNYDDDGFDNESLPAKKDDDKKETLDVQKVSEEDIKNLLIQNLLALSNTSMAMGKKVDQNNEDIKDLDGRVTVIEQRVEDNRMEHWQEKKIYDAVHKRVVELLGPKEAPNNKRYASYLFPCFWGSLNAHFNVSSYRDIREADFDKALEFAETWNPNGGIHEFMYETDKRIS